MRKNYFVTSFFSKLDLMKLKDKELKEGTIAGANALSRANAERRGVIRILAEKKKRIIIVIPSYFPLQDRKKIASYIDKLKQTTGNRQIRILRLGPNDKHNSGYWQRDTSVNLGSERVISREQAEKSTHKSLAKKKNAYFGEGGKFINAGEANGQRVVIVSSTPPYGFVGKKNPKIQSDMQKEKEMLQAKGYKVFELPGFHYRQVLGKTEFFNHIDPFINTIPKRKLVIVDPDYYKRYSNEVNEVAGFLGYSVIKVPESEKHLYPSNFLNIGEGEIILEHSATQTAKLLKAQGVKVFTTPLELKGNNMLFGGARCFVNEA